MILKMHIRTTPRAVELCHMSDWMVLNLRTGLTRRGPRGTRGGVQGTHEMYPHANGARV
jgi:hypothetical protein